jgi:hypothetical protein
MRGGVLEQLDLIIRTRNDFAVAHDHCAYRHFVSCVRLLRLSQCFAHEILVRQRFDHR